MAKLKTRSGVALKPKVIRVKTGEPDAVSEAPVASPSCSYTPGSLTSFLQSAATVKLVESGKVIGGKNKKGESSSASASTQKCTADSFQPVAADLQKLRAFFEGVDKKPESAQNEALRAFDRNSISKGVSTAQRRKTVVDVLVTRSSVFKNPQESTTAAEPGPETATAGDSEVRQPAAGQTASTRERKLGDGSSAKEAEATELERLQRTLFVGNLPVRDPFKPTELYRHLGLAKAQMRLRSVPVDAKFQKCRRAAIARQKFSSACDQQNAYIVLKEKFLVEDLIRKQFPPFKSRELRLDSASRGGFSLFDRKRSVCVGGLPREATETHLKQALEAFGTVQRIRVLRDRVTRASKGLGFVCFADRGSATKAVLASTCMVLGRPVRLMRALTEEECKTKEAEQNKRAKGGGKSHQPAAVRRIMARRERKLKKRQANREATRAADKSRVVNQEKRSPGVSRAGGRQTKRQRVR